MERHIIGPLGSAGEGMGISLSLMETDEQFVKTVLCH